MQKFLAWHDDGGNALWRGVFFAASNSFEKELGKHMFRHFHNLELFFSPLSKEGQRTQNIVGVCSANLSQINSPIHAFQEPRQQKKGRSYV